MATGAQHSMAYVKESTFGTTPSNPAFIPIRHISTNLGIQKGLLESAEIRSDRNVVDVLHGAIDGSGDIVQEICYDYNDDLLEAVMCGSKNAFRKVLSTTLSATTTTFTRGAGSFASDFAGLTPPFNISVTGFSNADNNGRFRVTAVAAGTLTVTALDGQTMVVETGSGDEAMESERYTLKNGTTRRSYTIERLFNDITSNEKYLRLTGVELNTLNIAINAEGLAQMTIGCLAKLGTLATSAISGATYATVQTTSPMTAFNATINEGGSTIAVVTEAQINLDNGLAPIHVIGSASSIEPSISKARVTGSITAYFSDMSLYKKFINETESSFDVQITDAATNAYKITIPKLKYTGGNPDVGGDGPVIVSFNFQAKYSSSDTCTLKIERLPV